MAFEKFEWECINNDEDFAGVFSHTYRAKVIGGWLVRHMDVGYDDENAHTVSSSMVFIKDITHEWKLPQHG